MVYKNYVFLTYITRLKIIYKQQKQFILQYIYMKKCILVQVRFLTTHLNTFTVKIAEHRGKYM